MLKQRFVPTEGWLVLKIFKNRRMSTSGKKNHTFLAEVERKLCPNSSEKELSVLKKLHKISLKISLPKVRVVNKKKAKRHSSPLSR